MLDEYSLPDRDTDMFVLPQISNIVLAAGPDRPIFRKIESHFLLRVHCVDDHEDNTIAAIATPVRWSKCC